MEGFTLQPGPAKAADAEAIAERLKIEARARSGADWFFWIAGLSLVNSILMVTGSNWQFIFGLGITQVVDVVAAQMGGQAVGFMFDALAAGVFVLFGWFARQRQRWAFLVGMTVYALDGLLLLFLQDYVSAGVHVFALWLIYGGLAAANQLKLMDSAGPAPLG